MESIDYAKSLGLLDEKTPIHIIKERLERISVVFSDKTLDNFGLRKSESNDSSKIPENYNDSDTSRPIIIPENCTDSDTEDYETESDDEEFYPAPNTFWDIATLYLKGVITAICIDKNTLQKKNNSDIPKYNVCKINGEYFMTFKSSNFSKTLYTIKCTEHLLKKFAEEYNIPKNFYQNEYHKHNPLSKCEHCTC